jgi:hypothetical protein
LKERLDPMAIMQKIGKSKKDPVACSSSSKNRSVDTGSSSVKKGNDNSIERMRQERLQREQGERKREMLLINPELANQVADRDARHANEGGYYNSRYRKR